MNNYLLFLFKQTYKKNTCIYTDSLFLTILIKTKKDCDLYFSFVCDFKINRFAIFFLFVLFCFSYTTFQFVLLLSSLLCALRCAAVY